VVLEGSVYAELRPTKVADHDADGILDLMVKFDRSQVADLLEPADEVTLEIGGTVGGVPFSGTDTIRVIDKGKKPMNGTAPVYVTFDGGQHKGGLYYYHLDHLGTPQLMTDESGAVVWSADYMPFGEAEVTVGGMENNIRFPGQYYDAETGLHYNYHRYYHARTGRYLSPDRLSFAQIQIARHSLLGSPLPILSDRFAVDEVQRFLISDLLYRYSLIEPQVMGLYPYVQNSPINFVDPYGLSWSIGSSFGLLIADYGWDTSAPGKGKLNIPIGQLGGAGWHITWTSDTKTPVERGEATTAPVIWNVGLGKYLGISVADDLSGFSFNIGLGLGLPVSASLPLEGDVSFGEWLHDILHPTEGVCK